jgi:5-methylcytosine-specific restriction endonuclease McrA
VAPLWQDAKPGSAQAVAVSELQVHHALHGTNGARPASARRVATPPGVSSHALVLNASMEPLCVVPTRRAVVLVLSSKADLLHACDGQFRAERMALPAPSVVRLRRYVHVPYRRRAALSRRGVFVRDDGTCQYCGRTAENVDHVVPRSRGGPHVWENVVAACERCNAHKKDRTPDEAGMMLSRRPFAPRAAFWLVVAVGTVDPRWAPYIQDVLAP